MAIIWVMVADSSRATLYNTDSSIGALQAVESFDHPAARQHVQALTSDLPGRAFDSAGQGRHAMEQKTDPKQQEAINFAKDLGKRLDTATLQQAFDRLVLVAPPAFLGLLRQQLGDSTQKLISTEIAKNLTGLDAKTVRTHLPERI